MESRYKHKVNWLVTINIGLGAISFLLGVLPLIMFVLSVSRMSGWYVSIPLLESLVLKFGDWIFKNSPATISTIGFIFGLAALVVGFFASISIEEKKQRGISFIGTILGSLGMAGSASFVVFFVLAWDLF